MSYTVATSGTDSLDFHGYDREVIENVWGQALVVPGYDPALWRKDQHGAWMHRMEYRNRRAQFGWEIANAVAFVLCPARRSRLPARHAACSGRTTAA